MAVPRIEIPTGAINGVNTIYVVALPYAPGEVSVFLNGLLQREDFDDGWIETNPAVGIVTLKEAPQTGDVVQIFYLPAAGAGAPDVCAAIEIRGVIEAIDTLEGQLRAPGELRGVLCRCACA